MFEAPGQVVTAYTDGSADKRQGIDYGGWGMHIETDANVELEAWQGMPDGTTNNRAEMQAFNVLLQVAMHNKWSHLSAFLDSKYVIDGITDYIHTWKRNGWVTRKGLPVVNKDLWLELDETWQKFKRSPCTIKIDWVKGHSGVRGNEIADKAAKRGFAASMAENYELNVKPLGKTDIEDAAKEKKNKPKKKIPPYNALICGNQILDTTNYGRHNPNVVFTGTWESPAKDDVPHRFIGVASADRFEGAVLLNEPDPILEMIRAKQREVSPVDVEIPVVLNWSKIVSAKNWKVFHEQGEAALLANKRGDLNFWDNDTEITFQFFVPRMAWFSVHSMADRLDLIHKYESGDSSITTVNVTDSFAKISEKGKYELQDWMKTHKRKDFIVEHPKTKEKIIVPMVQSKSIPDRNTFSRIVKQDKRFEAHLIFHSVTATTMRWSILIKTPSATACFDGPDTNLLLSP